MTDKVLTALSITARSLYAIFVFFPSLAFAQLYTPGGDVGPTNSSSGNVGIGVVIPLDNLHVVGTSRLTSNVGLPENATADDVNNYTEKYAYRFTSSNNGFYIAMSNQFNSRHTYLQSGHRDSPYASMVGRISLNPFGGNVGVGTTKPAEKFQIGDRWTFHDGGHKIIGYNFRFEGNPLRILEDEASALRFTESGAIRFDVAPLDIAASPIHFTTALTIHNNGNISWGNGGTLKPDQGSSIELGGAGTPYIDFKNSPGVDYDARLILNDDNTLMLAGANFLIGKSEQANTAYKIDVAGKIRANEIVVNTDGADHVFDPSYALTALDTLEAYVRKHRHLPGIATASEMQREGMAVGETTTKLLEKVEELTLYMIEMKKSNDALREENRRQQAEIDLLRNLVELKQ